MSPSTSIRRVLRESWDREWCGREEEREKGRERERERERGRRRRDRKRGREGSKEKGREAFCLCVAGLKELSITRLSC
jgi:hypothetical protein